MSQPLYTCVDLTFNGERELIEQTLDALADALQAEVSARKSDSKPAPRPVDASGFLNTVSAQSSRLAAMFAEAGPAFQRAVEPSGNPQMFVDTYASILDNLKAANDAILSIVPPPAFERTAEAYRDLRRAVHEQVTAWPGKLREAAKQVHGNSHRLKLEVNVEMTPYERAFEADKAALGI